MNTLRKQQDKAKEKLNELYQWGGMYYDVDDVHELVESVVASAYKAGKEDKVEEVIAEVDLSIEAWMNVHEDLQRSFSTKDLVKYIKSCLSKKI